MLPISFQRTACHSSLTDVLIEMDATLHSGFCCSCCSGWMQTQFCVTDSLHFHIQAWSGFHCETDPILFKTFRHLSSSSSWTCGAEVLDETSSSWQWGKRRWNLRLSHKGQIAWPWGWVHEQLREYSSKETAEICWGISQHITKWWRLNWAEREADW